MAGVQADDGQFRIYYQGKDYKIYEMVLLQAGSTKSQIRDLSTSMPVPARINTPIAAFQWNSLQCVRIFKFRRHVHSDRMIDPRLLYR
jgi:hypothetical protein